MKMLLQSYQQPPPSSAFVFYSTFSLTFYFRMCVLPTIKTLKYEPCVFNKMHLKYCMFKTFISYTTIT